MLTRIIAGLMVGIVFIGTLLFAPIYIFTAVMIFMTIVASQELLSATKVTRHSGTYLLTAISAAMIPLGYMAGIGDWITRGSLIFLMVLTFSMAIFRYERTTAIRVEEVFACLFAGVVIPSSLAAFILLRQMEYGFYLALLPVIAAFSTDSGAYFVGIFFGKHRGITMVSPKKSAEGYIGGIFFGVVFMLLFGVILQRYVGIQISLPILALYGLIGSVISELGDLSFSLIKRQYGVKDYGALIPGHGGMLDRFDSMTFVAPTMLLLVEILPPF